MIPIIPREKKYFWKTVLFTLAFYLSGLFVWFTPLPLVFQLQRKKLTCFLQVVFSSLLFLFILYFFALPFLQRSILNHPTFNLVVSIPGLTGDSASSDVALLYGLGYFLFFVVSAVIVNRALSLLKYFEGFLVLAAFGFFLATAGAFFFYAHHMGESAFSEMIGYYHSLLTELLKIGEQNQNLGAELAFMKSHSGEIANYLALFTPAFMVITFLVVLLLNVAVAQKVILPLTAPLSLFRLSSWQVPFAGIWLTIVLLIALLVNSTFQSDLLLGVSGNLLLVLCFIYFMQGLALIMFFFEKKGLSLFMRFSIYMSLFLFFQMAGLLVTALGFVDAWVDFRKRQSAQKKL